MTKRIYVFDELCSGCESCVYWCAATATITTAPKAYQYRHYTSDSEHDCVKSYFSIIQIIWGHIGQFL